MRSVRRSCSPAALGLLALLAGACTIAPGAAEPSPSPARATAAVTPAIAIGPPGTISGTLTYPGEPGTPIVVYAIPFDPIDAPSVRVTWSGGPRATFTLSGVPDGDYILVAYPVSDATGRQQGSYTEASFCGLGPGCDDHTPIILTVTPRFGWKGLVISDWDPPPGGWARRPSGP